MSSKTDICNMALAHLAVGEELTDVDVDRSKEAKACRRFYDNCRDTLLRSFPWPWATVTVDLTLYQEDPNEEWLFSYDMPADVARIIRIFSGTRPETRAQRIPYRQISDTVAPLIYTNQPDARIEYIEQVTDTEAYPPDFLGALSLYLASFISPLVTGGDQFKLGARAAAMFSWLNEQARVNAALEEQVEEPGDSSFEAARV